MEDLTGKQFGHYQIIAPLGEGGMAAVYKAYHPAMERYVALKVLPRNFANDPQFVARFEREAKVLAKLQHPHILPVFDFGQADGYTYIVMPFIESGTLTELLKGQPLADDQIRQIITQIGEALNYAHTHGLIHRDVKPSNVLIDESGNCLLTDFGLAHIVEASVNLTTSGTVVGTPAYMSPEQGSGQKIDARSDIYSLGVILYELATGRVPYKAETPVAVVFKHIQDPLPPAHELNPYLTESLELVILKALSKRPEDRYQTAKEMVKAIQAALPDGMSPAFVPVWNHPADTNQPGDRKNEKPKKSIWLIWAGMGIFVVVAMLSAGFLLSGTPLAFLNGMGKLPTLTPTATSANFALATARPTQVIITATLPAKIPTPTPKHGPQYDPNDPEGFLGWYFHELWNSRDYAGLWGYLSDDFQQRLGLSYDSYVATWEAIGSIQEPLTITFEGQDGVSAKYRVQYTTLSRKSGYTDKRNDLYWLYFNPEKGHWEFK